MTNQQTCVRNSLLYRVPALRDGVDSQQKVFWVVSSLAAFLLMISLVIDLSVNWLELSKNPLTAAVSVGVLGLAIFWVVMPILLRDKFPLWAGLVAYVCALLTSVYNIAYSGDSSLAFTGLHVLPVLGLYIGWFWSPLRAQIIMALSVALLILSVLRSDSVAVGTIISVSNVVFALMIMLFAFIVGSYLRWRLEKKATTDPLTGVLNRRGSLEALRTQLKRSQRASEPLSLAVIDFDFFKQLNDTRGHRYGDEVLATTTTQWRAALRAYDIIGRTGGDEFFIIFPSTNQAEANGVLKRLRNKTDHAWTWGLVGAERGDTVSSLLSRADQGLYKWKQRPERAKRKLPKGIDDLEPRSTEESSQQTVLSQLSQGVNLSQSEFSLVSAGAALVCFIGVVTSLLTGDMQQQQLPVIILVIVALLASLIGVILPLVIGKKYPAHASLWASSIVIIVCILLTLFIKRLDDGLNLLLVLSLLALYLGAFAGTLVARALLLTGIILLILVFMTRFFALETYDHQIISISSSLYALLISGFLFEVGSYLYGRSSAHAQQDELTGALNRYGMQEFGVPELQRAARGGHDISVVIIDCVGFKKVNDSLGHAAGDQLLQKVVAHIKSNLETYDLIIRVGGDEFVLILPYMNLEETQRKLSQLQLSAPHPWVAGIAFQEGGDNLESLLARADLHLRQNRAKVFTE